MGPILVTGSPARLKTLVKKATWLSLPLVAAAVVSLRVKTHETVSLDAVPLKESRVIARALDFIDKNYVDPGLIDPFKMVRKAGKALERSIPPLIVHEKTKELELNLGEKRFSIPLSNPVRLGELPTAFGRTLGFLEKFYQGKLDDRDRLSLMLGGAIETLDPHSNYLPPKIYNEFKIGTKGNFGGLGIVIGIRDGDLTVIAPLEGTPAYEAGVKAKDKIIQIGDEATINMGLTEAVEKLRGPVGSRVSIVITRSSSSTPLKFSLTRALIHIQSVAGTLLENRKIAWMKIKNFQEDTTDQFVKVLRSFEKGGPLEGMILDMRNNPGGLLDQAVELSDFFLSKGVIVKTVGAHGETLEVEEARPGDRGENLPVVVLVNEGSASASEIVAGALQFNDRAVVIGNRTFGKGSVQTVYDLKDGSALKLTIAKYLTAQDQQVQSIGINPDVGLIPSTVTAKRVDIFEDVKKRELDLEEEDLEEKKRDDLPPPPLQMSYLAPESTESDDEEDNVGRIELNRDVPVYLAGKILEQPESRSLSQKETSKILPAVVLTLKGEEKERLKEALSKIGVDWSEGAKEGKPAGVVTVELIDEKERPRKGLAPGESGFVRITVENRGNAPFRQLIGVTESEDPLFANLEFPFGRISPQEKKVWKAPLKIPDFVHQRTLPVTLKFHEEFERLPHTPSFTLQIEEPPTPLYQYRYEIADDGSKGSRGNDNRKAERGETIALIVKVKNSGRGESISTIVNLKKEEGEEIFIEKGRDELGTLPPGGEKEAVLRVQIPSKTPLEKLLFDLSIHDARLGEDLADRLELPLGPGEPSPAPGVANIPPSLEIAENLPLQTDRSEYAVHGKAADDQEIRHLFIFVGDEKVFYQSPSESSRSLTFETSLSLKKGANLITLAAQDNRELTTRKQWIVWRGK